MNIIDPKQFDTTSLNEGKMDMVIENFHQKKKNEFIQTYSELSDIEQFYILSVLVLSYADSKMAKELFLDELTQDLRILRVLNNPHNPLNKHDSTYILILEELNQKYPKYDSYWSSEKVTKTIDKFLNK